MRLTSGYSLLGSLDEVAREICQILHGFQLLQRDLFGTGGSLEGKGALRGSSTGLPVGKADGVGEEARDQLGGDDVSARNGAAALGNPDLPVDVFGPEGQV